MWKENLQLAHTASSVVLDFYFCMYYLLFLYVFSCCSSSFTWGKEVLLG